jgi:hypothetical protein
MVDEYLAREGVAAGLQWNLHSLAPFAADEAARRFRVEREGSCLVGHVLYHRTSFFTLTAGWDPPPMEQPASRKMEFPMHYHLRFTPVDLPAKRTLGVVLCPGHAKLAPAEVHAERAGATEIARLGEDLVLIGEPGPIDYEDVQSDAVAVLVLGGRRYELGEEGGLSCAAGN